jgi:hypothetical protein
MLLLRTVARWRRSRLAAGASLLLGIGLLLLPQFDVLGFEAAFAAAVVLPIAAGTLGAGLRRSGLPLERPWASLLALLVAGGVLVAIPLLLVAANMLRAPVCDPLEGFLFFLLLPGCSAALAVVTGWFLALAVRSSTVATLLWALVVLATLALVGYRFYATPAVSFFGPFFGQYPGVLYDTLVPISGRLLGYRATNLVEAGALLAVAAFAWDAGAQRLSLRRLARTRLAPFVVLPLLGAVVAAYAWGPVLGHRTDTAFIGSRLGLLLRGPTCDVYAPRELSSRDAALLVDDCEFRARQIRRLAGLSPDAARVTVLVFRDEDEKAALMGAGRTSVAKPWRREVYVHSPVFPHPVLKHELAHVLLGELCSGPFHVPARGSGLLPLPGLIEGGAMAAEWPVDELTPHGWAAAMDRLGLLPPAATLVGTGFLGENAGLAYTATGSFVRWLVDRFGADHFRAMFAHGDFEAAYGRSLDALWTDWRRWLAGLELTDAQLATAKARFDVPGFFQARCPHAVAAALARRDERFVRGDYGGALAAQDDACRLSGDDPWQRVARLALAVAAGRTRDAERWAAALSRQSRLGGRLLDLVALLAADAAWLDGRADEARGTYLRLLPRTTRAGERRLLLAKLHAVEQPPVVQTLLRAYLLGTSPPGRKTLASAGANLAALEQAVALAPDDAIAGYLLARARLNLDRWDEVLAPLDRALALGLGADELRLEALALRAAVLYRAGNLAGAERDAHELATSSSVEYRAEGDDWLERILWKRGG